MDGTEIRGQETPAALRGQIELTRAALGHKLESLHNEVRATFQPRWAPARVAGDFRRRVQARPAVTVLCAVVLGCILGGLSAARRRPGRDQPRPRPLVQRMQTLALSELAQLRGRARSWTVEFLQEVVQRAFPGALGGVLRRLLGSLV
jgi:hypothetical protein